MGNVLVAQLDVALSVIWRDHRCSEVRGDETKEHLTAGDGS